MFIQVNRASAEEQLNQVKTGKCMYLDRFNRTHVLIKDIRGRLVDQQDVACDINERCVPPEIEYAITGRVDGARSAYGVQSYLACCN